MALSLRDLQTLIRGALTESDASGADRPPSYVIKGKPILVLQAQTIAAKPAQGEATAGSNVATALAAANYSTDPIDMREYNAASIEVLLVGSNPSCILRVYGGRAKGGLFTLLPDGNATQTVTANLIFDVVCGQAWLALGLSNLSANLTVTVTVTPYVASIPSNASVNLAQYLGSAIGPSNPIDVRQVGLTPVAGTLAATTTPTALGSQASREVLVVARITNTTDVLLGDSVAQTDRLTPGQTRVIPASNVSQIFATMVSSTGSVDWWAA